MNYTSYYTHSIHSPQGFTLLDYYAWKLYLCALPIFFFFLFIRCYISVAATMLEVKKEDAINQEGLRQYAQWYYFSFASGFFARFFIVNFVIYTIAANMSSPTSRLLYFWWNFFMGLAPIYQYYSSIEHGKPVSLTVGSMLLLWTYMTLQCYFVGRGLMQNFISYVYWNMLLLHRFSFGWHKKVGCMIAMFVLGGNFWMMELNGVLTSHALL